ncbi:MAG: hypothetical protein JXA54_04610 [Candidatus Heimdallarchaeota archaeon]|nr:hypothetical protein [Candidatus Heimdallarchaeota archaeon]
MTEDIFTKNIQRIEKIYSILIRGDTNPQQESEMRVELIDVLSNLEATLIGEREHNNDFVSQLEILREKLLDWDPYGHWFRQQKELVDLVYEVIINAKNVIFKREVTESSEATRLKGELDVLKSELDDLRLLIKSLVKEKSLQSPIPVENGKAESSNTSLPWKKDQTKTQIISEETASSEILIKEVDELNELIQNDLPIEEEFIEEPPLILPVEIEKIVSEEDSSINKIIPEKHEKVFSPILPLEIESSIKDEQEDKPIISDEMLKKIAQDRNRKTGASSVINQMKTIISEAEKETEQHLSNFKEQLDDKESKANTPIQETLEETFEENIIAPLITEEMSKKINQTKMDIEEDPLESLIKMPDFTTKVEEDLRENDSTPEVDPYMQLLTLEAEKYRLERESEKNETEFQEGLKSKKDFDQTIQQIDHALTFVRERIKTLRNKLNS